MYRYIYRTESQYAHAAVMSLDALVIGGPPPASFQVQMEERDPGETNPFTQTPMIFALALLIAEHALGLAGMQGRIDAIFAA
jgi:hypothetical protein